MDGSWTHGNQARTLGPRRLPSASFLPIASPCLAPGPGRAGTACARPPGSSVVGLACLDSLADYHPRSFHIFSSSPSKITACRLPLPYCCTGTVGGVSTHSTLHGMAISKLIRTTERYMHRSKRGRTLSGILFIFNTN